MGDAEFAMSRFCFSAMEHYNKGLPCLLHNPDYVFLYQKSISYGFVDRNKQKINTLIELIDKHPRSAYIDDAFLELSSAYAVAGSFDTAINTYDAMIGRFPKSPYLPKAILNKGLILYNLEKLSLAESVLKNLKRFTKDAVQ